MAHKTIKAQRATKHDVDLAKIHRSHEIWKILAYGLVGGFWIAVASVPVWAFQSVIEPLAGNTTIVQANIVVSVSLALSVTINGFQYLKARSDHSTIKHLRSRVADLEQKVL